MSNNKTGFGTRTGFALAAAGSAIGLGNLWGFPYKVSANGGSAYLFVYIACILLLGAVAMTAEFSLGRFGRANTVSTFKKLSPKLGWAGLLAVLIPFLIMCYYYVLGGFSLKFALNSFAGNKGNFHSFAGNYGDVILHSFLFAFIAFIIVAAGVRKGIERTAKILMPTVIFFLILIAMVSLTLGEGVSEGIAYYLRPDFSQLNASSVLSAMGQAFFSLSLGCGVMIAYGSYSGEKVSITGATAAVCIIDVVITFLMGFAVFPAVFHYSAVTGISLSELGLGSFGLMFVTMSMVFEDIPYIGNIISLLFFSMAAIAAVTSVISLLEVVTQFIIQRYRVFRSRAALFISLICFLLSIPVAFSLGSSLNGTETVSLFGHNLFEYLDITTNTLLMPLCALMSCVAASKLIKRGGALSRGYFPVMVKFITPALIIVIEIFGIIDLIAPGGSFSAGGCGIVVTALVLVALCIAVYFGFFEKQRTGCNEDELKIDAEEAVRRKTGLPRGWSRPESEGEHEKR
ncbi:MAG: sodium-dependent transporter [Oscillospiraceae bacterium]|nr:sodium-dependent transporter [Oscillospiraceae bacterium]